MLAAFTASCLFSSRTSSITHRRARGPSPARVSRAALYFAILISHVLLAAAIVPLALVTLCGARFGATSSDHRRIARWTFPIWMYVSVTGVVIYWMLYGV